MNHLQSRFSIGEKVTVTLLPDGNMISFEGCITAIHFTQSKVKYDVEVKFSEEESTRIYNIDSIRLHSPYERIGSLEDRVNSEGEN